jgi:DNA-binding XRE family transcriptional regulator
MCNVNKTATFKKVFETTEESVSTLYKELPEYTTAQKVYKVRMLNNLTQKEFANKSGVGYSTICKYETGYNTSKNNIKKICNTFNLPYDYFY